MPQVHESFRARLSSRWRRTRETSGEIIIGEEGLRLGFAQADAQNYSNAMIDDYGNISRAYYPWKPPVRLRLRAKMDQLQSGTAGFGFWNNPLADLQHGGPSLPAALWFLFAAPPSDMPLAHNVPGSGWKAASIDATRPSALIWAPAAPVVMLLNRYPRLFPRVWRSVQRDLGISEASFEPDNQWHWYEIEWLRNQASLRIDGQTILYTKRPPRGPLGFVAWVDNQWAIATPQGRFGWGLSESTAQWLDIESLSIETLESNKTS